MNAPFNRGTGLIIIEARNSNPNGDPDQESDPRTLEADGRGVISPVSFKRKLRDMVAAEGDAFLTAKEKLKLGADGDTNRYHILESRERRRDVIGKMDGPSFKAEFWDARIFGNTFLESLKSGPDSDEAAKSKAPKVKAPTETAHFISTGVVQIGVGISIAPVDIDRMTMTNKAGVEAGKDRGMAPLGFRVVRHAVYAMPFFVNPSLAAKNGTTEKDLALLKFLIPHAYTQTSSAIRPFVNVLHAWYGQHKTPLGSCPDALFIDALMPKFLKGDAPSTGLKDDYDIPKADALPTELTNRFKQIVDLCAPKE
jgi:CRISPR-associated protein Csd2